jgi:predicted aspartyl protease
MACGRACLATAVFSGVMGGIPLQSTGTSAVVSFELYQRHLIVVKGSVGGLEGLSLLIDTGSIPSVLDDRIARRLNVHTEPSVLVAFGRAVPMRHATVDKFQVGPLQSDRMPVSVANLSYVDGVRLDGIVGLDLLARASFSIDYRKRTLMFRPTGREESVAPLEVTWPFLTVRVNIAGEQVRLLIDTGSSDLVLFRTPAALAAAPWRGDKTVLYASGPARLKRVELRQVGFGESVFEKLAAWVLDRNPEGYPTGVDGVLGVRSLGCSRVRFDFERNELGWSR